MDTSAINQGKKVFKSVKFTDNETKLGVVVAESCSQHVGLLSAIRLLFLTMGWF